MDEVLYIGKSRAFAIMREGSPERTGALKELQDAIDLRPDSAGFEGQLKRFLRRYGRHFAWDGALLVDDVTEDEGRLSELSYYLYRDPRNEFPALNRVNGDAASKGTYVVALHSPSAYTPAPAFLDRLEALRYVAELGLVSQGFRSRNVHFDPVLDEHFTTATYTLSPPPSLWLDLQGGKDGKRWGPLEGTLAIGLRQSPESFGDLTSCLVDGRPELTLRLYLRGYFSRDRDETPKGRYPDWVRTRPDGSPDECGLNMLAAGQLLSLVAERYHCRPRRFVVDPTTLKLRPNANPDLMGELVGAIASGKVHPCAYCGRPIMGGTAYCRGRRCHASDLERARRLADRGIGVDEIQAAFPHIKRATIEGYVEDARRSQ